MIKFDPQNYPYPSKRNVVYARNGMCNAGNPHAASAGLQTLLKGGNAVDAALAMARYAGCGANRQRFRC